MITFPNCKLNFGLNILEKRKDGFHNLETVFYPIPLKDMLEIVDTANTTTLSVSGLKIAGDENENLCLKAYRLLQKKFPEIPNIKIHLHKTIPMGAGLGGGSADAVFMLNLLNKKFNLSLSKEKLFDYSLQLGSDCPFFLINQPCFASERGEKLEETEMDLSGYKFLIIVPDIHVKTDWAYSRLELNSTKKPPGFIKEILKQPISTWKDILVNDFENIIFSSYPEIELIKKKLYAAGALYASMSGTGSAVYGLFKKKEVVNIPLPENYFFKELIT